jgi:hypothetical protein
MAKATPRSFVGSWISARPPASARLTAPRAQRRARRWSARGDHRLRHPRAARHHDELQLVALSPKRPSMKRAPAVGWPLRIAKRWTRCRRRPRTNFDTLRAPACPHTRAAHAPAGRIAGPFAMTGCMP